jgi:hypothetical protein
MSKHLLSIAILVSATVHLGVVVEVRGGIPAALPVCSPSTT